MTVQHVEPEDQRDLQPALESYGLPTVETVRFVNVQQAADPPGGDLALHLQFGVRRHAGVDHVQLAEFFLKRHRRQQAINEIGHEMLLAKGGQPLL